MYVHTYEHYWWSEILCNQFTGRSSSLRTTNKIKFQISWPIILYLSDPDVATNHILTKLFDSLATGAFDVSLRSTGTIQSCAIYCCHFINLVSVLLLIVTWILSSCDFFLAIFFIIAFSSYNYPFLHFHLITATLINLPWIIPRKLCILRLFYHVAYTAMHDHCHPY